MPGRSLQEPGLLFCSPVRTFDNSAAVYRDNGRDVHLGTVFNIILHAQAGQELAMVAGFHGCFRVFSVQTVVIPGHPGTVAKGKISLVAQFIYQQAGR